MERVVILGRGGAGKSVFATQLGDVTGLPVIELDAEFWDAGLEPLPPEECRRKPAWCEPGNPPTVTRQRNCVPPLYAFRVAKWSDYQEEVADFFRSLGLIADTNVSVTGVRTAHDVDVVVRSKHAGLDVLWLVECKNWKTAIPKEKILALRSIVDDTGADRGFMMAENGYQSGALEASRYANVMLSSLADLREALAYEVGMAKLRSIVDRVELSRERYWAISKSQRIDFGLRPDVGGYGYMGDAVMRAAERTVHQAQHRGFPILHDRTSAALASYGGGDDLRPNAGDEGAIETALELYDVLDAELSELEQRLDKAETVLRDGAGPLANP